jgi:hypothetical protein
VRIEQATLCQERVHERYAITGRTVATCKMGG